MSEFLVPPLSKANINDLALVIRSVFGLRNQAYFPVVELVEIILPELDQDFNYEIVEDDELGLDAANYNPITNLMKIRRSVYDGACKGNGRDRFTLAHELGHYFMHRDVDLAMSRINTHQSVPAYRNSEWQANAFASVLLMPDEIIEGWTIEEIAKACGTSLSAASVAYKRKRSNV